MSEIGLRVGGKEYRGWKTVRVTRGIEQLAGSFELTAAERWEDEPGGWPVGEGSECTVVLGDRTLITGYVDTAEPDLDGSVRLVGRDRAGDLVDCSALLSSWSFSDVDVLTLAQKIAAPFGVRVSVQPGLSLASVSLPKKYAIDPGDTAANALENLCRVSGLLAISDGVGGIVLSRAGTKRATTTIVQGVNLKGGRSSFSQAGRFGEYRVMGSHKGRDDLSGRAAAGVRGTARDANVRSSRVLVIRPEGNVTTAQASARAAWEASVRAARGDSVSLAVQGWKQADGSLWEPNTLVTVRSPRLRVNGSLLISQVTFALDEGGSSTTLDARNPEAYRPDPTIAKGGGNNYWKEIVKGVP